MTLPPEYKALNVLLNQSHYTSIGKVAANWAAFELLVSSALWRLAHVDDEPGACLTAQIPNIARRFDALRTLVKLRGGSDGLIKEINDFGNRTHGLQDQRNRVVHDPWFVDRKTGQIQRLEVSARHTLKFGYVPMPLADINAVADLIIAHINRFEELINRVFAEVETSHGTPPRSSSAPDPHKRA